MLEARLACNNVVLGTIGLVAFASGFWGLSFEGLFYVCRVHLRINISIVFTPIVTGHILSPRILHFVIEFALGPFNVASWSVVDYCTGWIDVQPCPLIFYMGPW